MTGAGSGIGRAVFILFAKEGVKVVVADLVAEGGEETVRMVKKAGGEAIYVHADATGHTASRDCSAFLKITPKDRLGEPRKLLRTYSK